jgi:hypothetical protein
MATTPGGLPYPVGTDKVVDGDDAIRNLATAVDTRPVAVAPLVTGGNLTPLAYYTIGQGGGFGSPELRGVAFSGAPAIFTVPVAGLYRVGWGIAFGPIAAPGTIRAARIDDGAATPVARASVYLTPSVGQAQTLVGTRLLRLAAGAALRLTAYHDAGGGVPVLPGDTYVSIEWAGV